MNAIQIRKMLRNIKADFIGEGRPWHKNDDVVMDAIMRVYNNTDCIDWEECKWLFVNYLQKGILDFPKATQMARKRLRKLAKVEGSAK